MASRVSTSDTQIANQNDSGSELERLDQESKSLYGRKLYAEKFTFNFTLPLERFSN